MYKDEDLWPEVRDVLIAPLVEWNRNEVLCDLVEVGLQGQIHIGMASVILEEAEKITECNSKLDLTDVNLLNPFKKPSGRCKSGHTKKSANT